MGGTGAVYLAVHEGNSASQAAMKLFMPPPQLSAEERADFQARFRREAQVLLELRHPHILALEGFGEDRATGYAYMVLPYFGEGTLANRLAHGPLSLAQAADYLAQLSSALDYAHSHGVIHRDIKPANVLLDAQGQAYLADFSIARLFSGTHTTLTGTGQVMGTPAYMAPEQSRGDDLGPEVDIYSLGVVLFEMVTGRVPFEGATPVDAILQHIQVPPPSPLQWRPDLPAPAGAVILRALAKQSKDRFASAGALALAFETGLRGVYPPDMPPSQWQAAQALAGHMASPLDSGSITMGPVVPTPTIVTPPASFLLPTTPASMSTPLASFSHRRRKIGLIAAAAAIVLVVVGSLAVFTQPDIRESLGFIPILANTPTPTDTPTPTPTPVPTDTPTPTPTPSSFLDALTANSHGAWEEDSNCTFQSNGYHVAASSSSSSGFVCEAPFRAVGNADIAVQTQQIDGPITAWRGLMFRIQDSSASPYVQGYEFEITSGGYWDFAKSQGSSTLALVPPTYTSAINTGLNVQNIIEVRSQGTYFDFYVNSIHVGSASDATYSSGGTGLIVDPHMTGVFTKFILTT
jgi:serine/threonine-protein kinase